MLKNPSLSAAPGASVFVFCLALSTIQLGGCFGPSECPDEGCQVSGRIYNRVSGQAQLVENGRVLLKNQLTDQVIGETFADDLGFFRFTDIDESDLFLNGLSASAGPEGIVACQGSSAQSRCYEVDYFDSCVASPLDEADDTCLQTIELPGDVRMSTQLEFPQNARLTLNQTGILSLGPSGVLVKNWNSATQSLGFSFKPHDAQALQGFAEGTHVLTFIDSNDQEVLAVEAQVGDVGLVLVDLNVSEMPAGRYRLLIKITTPFGAAYHQIYNVFESVISTSPATGQQTGIVHFEGRQFNVERVDN